MFIIIFPSHLHSLTVRYFAYHLIGIFHVLVHSMLLTVLVLPLSLSSAPWPSCCYITLYVPCSSQDGRGGGRGVNQNITWVLVYYCSYCLYVACHIMWYWNLWPMPLWYQYCKGGGGVKCTTSHAAIKEVAILAFRWRDGIRHAQFGQTTRMNKVATCLKETVLPVVFVCSCFVSFK